MSLNINNKIKQFFGGNWGHPGKFIKKETNVPDGFFADKPCTKAKKKKRKKKKYIPPYSVCPFCDEELIRLEVTGKKSWWCINNYETICRECGARRVNDCPACKNATWFQPETGIYKHQWIGCGFEGKRIHKSIGDIEI